ncbi:hypothetical protein TSUD_360260 [Trifolium subterraneum]|uniref:Uncharacterized protein n=1 Tax=Trifolium subterraneum TaxID=3900 RepID=A0A2Z6MJY7_TRISU|nr:hypothetical protein TSUD_360260 [Trifolium subterraneum]
MEYGKAYAEPKPSPPPPIQGELRASHNPPTPPPGPPIWFLYLQKFRHRPTLRQSTFLLNTDLCHLFS